MNVGLSCKVDKTELDSLLFKIWALDCKSGDGNQFFETIPLTAHEKKTLEVMYDRVLSVLVDAYCCLKNGGEVMFFTELESGKGKVERIISNTQGLTDWVQSLDNLGMNTTRSKKIILEKLMSI